MKTPTLSIDALNKVVAALPEDNLAESRRAALDQLRQDGMPGSREENWKYTDLSGAVAIANRWLEEGAEITRADAAAADDIVRAIDADWIVIDNGQVDAQAVDGTAISGVEIKHLNGSAGQMTPSGRLGDLNAALLRDGLSISVAASTELARPIGILIVDHADSAPTVSQIRVDIDVAANSSASFIEFHTSEGDADLYANSVVNVTLGDGSRADYVRIQDRDRVHEQTGYQSVTVGRDAELRHCAFDFGGRMVRNDLVIDLANPGGSAEFAGLYLIGDGQHIDNHTRTDHRTGPTESHQEYRGILTGKARGVWNGKAIVHEGADGTDAEQANHNLVLSKNAEIDAKPELEIYADDVKCSHGTTVGQLDETALFYLRTRGLSRHDAKQVLTRAFAQAIVGKSPISSLHDFLAVRIAARLDQLMQETDA
jgi:Fe-S cluster assembly protein SufD